MVKTFAGWNWKAWNSFLNDCLDCSNVWWTISAFHNAFIEDWWMTKLCLGNNVMLLITEYKKTKLKKDIHGDTEKLFEWPNTQQKLLLVAAFC